MTNSTCYVVGCAKQDRFAGLCRAHYSERMKAKRPCSVEGCSQRRARGGMCVTHWRRQELYGDPFGGKPYGAGVAFVRQAAEHDGDDCLIWPYAKSTKGYGRVFMDGKAVYAHRRVLELAVGPPPGPGYHAAHAPLICHNPSCVNPRHLRWATPTENVADMLLDGTRAVRA